MEVDVSLRLCRSSSQCMFLPSLGVFLLIVLFLFRSAEAMTLVLFNELAGGQFAYCHVSNFCGAEFFYHHSITYHHAAQIRQQTNYFYFFLKSLTNYAPQQQTRHDTARKYFRIHLVILGPGTLFYTPFRLRQYFSNLTETRPSRPEPCYH